MNMKKLNAVIFAIILPLSSFAAIDLLSIISQTGPIDSHLAQNLLSTCYMHNPQQLTQATTNVDELKQINGNTVFLCSVKYKSLPTEYYLTTISNRHGLVVDGALLGYNGDSKILILEHPNDEMVYQPTPELNFEYNSDTVKVIRKYIYFSTMRGGKTFEKKGTIIMPFVIGSDGKINKLQPNTFAIQTTGDANYLSTDREPTVTTTSIGEFYPPGMQVLSIAQQPASTRLDINNLNEIAEQKSQLIEQYGENAKENSETLSIMEFARWTFNQGMLHSNDFLTWIANNPKEQHLTQFIDACASDNTNGELQWIKDKVKSLKDKKARKWWQKWIKKHNL